MTVSSNYPVIMPPRRFGICWVFFPDLPYGRLFSSVPWLIHHPMFLPHLWLSEPFSTAPDESRVYSSYTSPSRSRSIPPSLSPSLLQWKPQRRAGEGTDFNTKRPFSASGYFWSLLWKARYSAAYSAGPLRIPAVSQIRDVGQNWSH